MTGPRAAAAHSVACSSDVAFASSSSSTRFGTPASTAGRKNEFAVPATAASATIPAALPTNGSAAKTTRRARSDATISRLRESRSSSGPAASPTTTDGRKLTRKSALTHHGECVRAVTSAVSAIVAIHVPTPEPSVARKSRRKLAARRRSANWRPSVVDNRRSVRDPAVAGRPRSGVRLRRLEHAAERRVEDVELLEGADRDADRSRGAESTAGPDDHAL